MCLGHIFRNVNHCGPLSWTFLSSRSRQQSRRRKELASSHPGSQHVSVSAQSIPASLFSIFEEEMIILSAFLKYVYKERFERKGSVFY